LPEVSAIAQELASQPESWRLAIDLAATVASHLPSRGERAAVVGCGTSLYVARAFAALRESRGSGETDAFPASEFPEGRAYERIVVISRSGTTTEVVRLLERRAAAQPTVAITASAHSPVSTRSGSSVVLDFADERSVVQTRFATSALAMLRTHLGEDLTEVVAEGAQALGEPEPPGDASVEHVVFLGHGWSVGIAEEAALKLREAARAYTEAYPAMEYRHGPISLAGPSSLVWILSTPDPALAEDVARTGATVRVATLDPMAELVRVHRMAVAMAEARGLDPDRPQHLTRSVVLT
jgi:fructoselysine-6-P-deglycase FrlB-like protein